MINLKNLKSLFIEEDGTTPSTPKNSEAAEKSVVEKEKVAILNKKADEPTNTPSQDATNKSPKPELDPRSYEKMMNIITSNNIDGFDYLEFKSSLKALNNTPLDEENKFKSAFAMAQTMGLTKEKLLKTAEYYKNLLEQDKDGFRTHLKTAVQEKAKSYTSQKSQLTKMIAQKEAEVKKLTEQITQHKAQLDDVCDQESNMESKALESRDKYLGTYQFIAAQFDKDITKIKQYLMGK